MKTLGIFGDSFAAPSGLRDSPCWFDYLTDQYNIVNFAKTGSSIYYSYTKFLENYKNLDRIIFVVTAAERIWLKNLPNQRYSHITGSAYLTETLNSNSGKDLITVENLQAARQFYMYLSDDRLHDFKALAMLKNIKKNREDTLLITGISNSTEIQEFIGHEHSLTSISALELKVMSDINHWSQFNKYLDTRNCHLTDENNKILGYQVLKWLDTNTVNINLDEFEIPLHRKHFQKTYLIKKDKGLLIW